MVIASRTLKWQTETGVVDVFAVSTHETDWVG